MNWIDQRLSWLGKFNSSYDQVKSIIVPVNMIWQPDVTFYDVIEVKDLTAGKSPAKVFSNGRVHQIVEVQVTSKCQLKLLNFPYDRQTCVLKLANIMITESVALQIGSLNPSDTVTTFLTESNEYCLLRMSNRMRDMTTYAYIEFSVTFQRRSTFYLVNLILPSILLLAISALTFRLPPECGERVSFSVTIVLSMCVFLQLSGNYTPNQSESVTLLTGYYSLAVVMTMANVLGNVFVLGCHLRQQADTL
uniref:Neur_chan_LBD domain-containing protein n=1 Tax=Macrostomum lignano TaxID=282301 RepID=A0A1I8HXL4_9PLAT